MGGCCHRLVVSLTRGVPLALTVLATALSITLVKSWAACPGQQEHPAPPGNAVWCQPPPCWALLLLLASGILAWARCLLLPAFPRVHSPSKREVKEKQAMVFSPLASSRQSLGTGARLPELVIHCAHGVFISSQCCAVGIQQKYDTFNWERNGRPQATTATGFIIVAGIQHIDSATI